MSTTTPCANYNYFSYKINAYLNGCFRPISAALAPVKLPAANTISLPITWPGTTYGDIKFSPGNIMGGGSILDNGHGEPTANVIDGLVLFPYDIPTISYRSTL